MNDVDALLAEADARPFTGWDFSWLGERVSIEPPWDYTEIAHEITRTSPDLLDMGTGGGEWLAGLRARPPLTIASEAWPPNVAIAARTLRVVGAFVVQDEGAVDNDEQATRDPRGRLPYRRGSLHAIVNRHEAFVAREVARVLVPGGEFLTQQVDNGNLDDCFAMLGRGDAPATASWLPLAVAQTEAAGLEILDARTGVEAYRFADVGALAWYLKAVGPLHDEWAAFTISRYRDAFVRLDAEVRAGRPLLVRQRRLLVRARR